MRKYRNRLKYLERRERTVVSASVRSDVERMVEQARQQYLDRCTREPTPEELKEDARIERQTIELLEALTRA